MTTKSGNFLLVTINSGSGLIVAFLHEGLHNCSAPHWSIRLLRQLLGCKCQTRLVLARVVDRRRNYMLWCAEKDGVPKKVCIQWFVYW